MNIKYTLWCDSRRFWISLVNKCVYIWAPQQRQKKSLCPWIWLTFLAHENRLKSQMIVRDEKVSSSFAHLTFAYLKIHIKEKKTYNTWVPHHPICRFRGKFFVMHQITCNLYCRRKLQRLQSLWTGTEVELSLRTVAFRKTNLSRNEA